MFGENADMSLILYVSFFRCHVFNNRLIVSLQRVVMENMSTKSMKMLNDNFFCSGVLISWSQSANDKASFSRRDHDPRKIT